MKAARTRSGAMPSFRAIPEATPPSIRPLADLVKSTVLFSKGGAWVEVVCSSMSP
jgi:hypothetical protein